MSESTDLDPGYVITHDDPHHANVELAAQQAKQAALIGRVVTTSRDGDGIVVKTYAPDCVNLVRLSDLRVFTSMQDFATTDAPPTLAPRVYYRHSSGVQFVALVVAINADLQLDLLVLSDGYVDLGSGPGVPVRVERVTHGAGRLGWQTEMDA